MKFSVVTPLWQDRPATENLEIARLADQLGYRDLWIGEMATFDSFALATAIGLQTEHINMTLGPFAVSVRTPMTIAMGAASVSELTGRQIDIALGASSTVVVEEWHGRKRARTATHMDETALIVRELCNGEKTDFAGELSSCKGYRLRLDAPKSSITLAAFSPAAVRAAARRADRMLLNMVTPNSLANLRQLLTQAAEKLQKPIPKIAVWLATGVAPQRETIDQLKRTLVGYLAAPGYGEMMAEAGFSELVQFARTRPHPRDLLAAMPDELVAATGLLGTEDEIEQRIEQYRDAGADEICLVPATAGDDSGERTLRAMSRYLKK